MAESYTNATVGSILQSMAAERGTVAVYGTAGSAVNWDANKFFALGTSTGVSFIQSEEPRELSNTQKWKLTHGG